MKVVGGIAWNRGQHHPFVSPPQEILGTIAGHANYRHTINPLPLDDFIRQRLVLTVPVVDTFVEQHPRAVR
jgi:hypothetical protein